MPSQTFTPESRTPDTGAIQMHMDDRKSEDCYDGSIDSEKAQLIYNDDLDIEASSAPAQQRRWARATLSTLAVIAISFTAISYLVPNVSHCIKPTGNTQESKSLNFLSRRADSPTDACLREGQQSAIVNGSLYLYGGATTRSNSFSKSPIKLF
jgi:hypothetical protein